MISIGKRSLALLCVAGTSLLIIAHSTEVVRLLEPSKQKSDAQTVAIHHTADKKPTQKSKKAFKKTQEKLSITDISNAVSAPAPNITTLATADSGATGQAPQAQKKEETIALTIKNSITPDMLAYHHSWFGTHSPKTFSIEINGEEIKPGEEKTVTLPKDSESFEMVYKYDFAKGCYKDSRPCSVAVPKNSSRASLLFSWLKEENRLWLEPETPAVTA